MKNIIFDWSGVISNNIDDHLNHINYLFAKQGGPKISKRELRQKWVQPYMEFYNQYFPNMTLKEHQKLYSESADKFISRKIFKGMKPLLLDLKRKRKRLFVISGDSPKTLFAEMKEYGLSGMFDKVVTHSHDKLIDLTSLIKSEKLDPKKTVFIGDTVHEVECAKAVKIKSIAVTRGLTTPSRLKSARPDFIVDRPRQLKNVLLK